MERWRLGRWGLLSFIEEVKSRAPIAHSLDIEIKRYIDKEIHREIQIFPDFHWRGGWSKLYSWFSPWRSGRWMLLFFVERVKGGAPLVHSFIERKWRVEPPSSTPSLRKWRAEPPSSTPSLRKGSLSIRIFKVSMKFTMKILKYSHQGKSLSILKRKISIYEIIF